MESFKCLNLSVFGSGRRKAFWGAALYVCQISVVELFFKSVPLSEGIQLVPTVISAQGCPTKPSETHYLDPGVRAESPPFIPFFKKL